MGVGFSPAGLTAVCNQGVVRSDRRQPVHLALVGAELLHLATSYQVATAARS